MRINDFEEMQRSLEQMRTNLEDIKKADYIEPQRTSSAQRRKGRHVAQKKINQIEHPKLTKIAREEHIIVMVTIAIVAITCIFSTTIFAKSISENTVEKQEVVQKEEENDVPNVAESEVVEEKETQAQPVNSNGELILENNEDAIELENILMENVSVLKSKEYAEEVRPIEFETKYNDNPNLPEGEEVVVQEGVDGTQQVTVIKSYENNQLISENVLSTMPLGDSTPQIVDRGTSKFLAENKVHLDDKMYVTKEVELKKNADNSSDTVCQVLESLDVVLVELDGEDWCKINYDGLEGYVECKNLTSSQVTPEIVEANRVQRIKMTLSESMPLNESTDLTLEDYQKMLSGNASDKKHILEENAEVFYNMDKIYHMNGVFLASMAIHESAWGTSTIANDKKNLFGYGAYDSSPYQSSFSFDTYAEGIELVAKALVKYYLNAEGTPIYEGEVAKGSYYTEPTVASVNTRYASDQNWHNKVYSYMEYLYNRL